MSRIDLNRIRKIYPQMKKSPRYFNQTNEIKAFTVVFSSMRSASLTVGAFSSAPVVVVTGDDNVNLWVSSIALYNNEYQVTIMSSHVYSGTVHVHVHEVAT